MSFVDRIARSLSGSGKNASVEEWCRANGWSVDEYRGDTRILHFKGDAIRPRRDVLVTPSEGDDIAIFDCPCDARFGEHNFSGELAPLFLLRNTKCLGSWTARLYDNAVHFVCRYMAITTGMDAVAFRCICTSLVEEVADTENQLRHQGLM